MDEQDKKIFKKSIRLEVLIGVIISFVLIISWHVYLGWRINQTYLYELYGTWATEDGSFSLNKVAGEQDGCDVWAVLTIDGKKYTCEVNMLKSLAWFVAKENTEETQQNSDQPTQYAVWDAKVTVKEKGNVLKVEIIKDYLSDDEGEVILLYRQ